MFYFKKNPGYGFHATLFMLIFLIGCNQPDHSNQQNKSSIDTEKDQGYYHINIEFAKGFSVDYLENHKLVTVHEPWKNAPKSSKYLLIPAGNKVPEHDKDVQVVSIPVQSIASLSTTHIPFLEMLQEHHKLTGFASPDFISSPTVRKMIDEGKVRDIGPDGSLNLEVLADLSPEAIMAFGTGTNSSLFNKVNQMGIPVILNADYLENSALGRAEWIKFTSLFFNKEAEADSIFNSIRNKYDSLKSLAQKALHKPTVYSGIVYGDIWYVPAGQSWASELLDHAGADYLWKNEGAQGNLELSFEKVYEKAADADFWIGAASFNSLEEIKNADTRYADFNAYKKRNVYTYNAKIGKKGGNEYLELGYARPDIILADLIKIFYPAILPDYQMYFYKRLPVHVEKPKI